MKISSDILLNFNLKTYSNNLMKFNVHLKHITYLLHEENKQLPENAAVHFRNIKKHINNLFTKNAENFDVTAGGECSKSSVLWS